MSYRYLYIPLDERPCNYDFAYEIFNDDFLNIQRVPFEYMGLKKKPGNIEKINDFLIKEAKNADGIVLSIDTLLYGGIVPSRLHFFDYETVAKRLSILKKVKKENPNFKIYAFNLVMRCPRYNDDDEEPNYYLYHGLDLFNRKYIQHRMALNIATQEEIDQLAAITIPQEYIDDYESRRAVNCKINLACVELVKEKIIDFLIIPQDDSAPYGYTALDQLKIKNKVREYRLQDKVLTYPGADEVGNTLFARVFNTLHHQKPIVYLHYPSPLCKTIIPCAEDRPLDISARYQIIAAGGIVASTIQEADLVFAINAPGKEMLASQYRNFRGTGYSTLRNLEEFVSFIEYCIDTLKKPVTIGDVGYCNGSDPQLISLIEEKKLYFKLAGYASWNIPCNSLGTALPMGMHFLLFKDKQKHYDFLMHRFVEDAGYDTFVRKIVREEYCEKMGYTIYDIGGQRGDFSELVKKLLDEQVAIHMPYLKDKYQILDLYMPWSRTYEIGLKIKYKGEIQ